MRQPNPPGTLANRSCRAALLPALAGALFAATAPAAATVGFDISFNDPGAAYASYYTALQSTVLATGNDWINHFAGLSPSTNTTLSVQISFASIATASGGSATSGYVKTVGGIDVFEQGAAYKLNTGVDNNGAAPDILFNVGINGYLQNELWFDPNPVAQTAVVPGNQTDARSVFLHEFGHAFGFNGFRNGTTGQLPGTYESTFDQFTQLVGTANGPTVFFTGANAVAAYGGAVPITFGNYTHVGNNAPRAGSDLIGDLMNGVVYYRGTRYQISALDLAIMQDAGLPVAVPEPSIAWLMSLGLLGLLGLRPFAKRRAQGVLSA